MRNIELKARLPDLAAARATAEKLATKRLGTQHQIDTYFDCRHGRLKLRQIDGLRAELIWYDRPDLKGPKTSNYRLVPVSNPVTLKNALAAALGVLQVVEKRREIFLFHNVRIHLDQVAGLGEFIEFEAVVGQEADEAVSHARLDELVTAFAIAPADKLARSYGEMLDKPAGLTGGR